MSPEYALSQRDLQIEQMRQGHLGGPMGPGGKSGVVHPAANGNYAGLHGQMDPTSSGFTPLPVQMQQPVPTRDTQQTMSAFSSEPGLDSRMGAGDSDSRGIQINQTGGAGGTSQFTPLQ
jgi:hypothetical protein